MAAPFSPVDSASVNLVKIDGSETWVEGKRFTVKLRRLAEPGLLSKSAENFLLRVCPVCSFAAQVYKVVVKTPLRSWFVFRRYNEFHALHNEVQKEKKKCYCRWHSPLPRVLLWT